MKKILFFVTSFFVGLCSYAFESAHLPKDNDPTEVSDTLGQRAYAGLSEEEQKFSHEFASKNGKKLRVVFKTSVEYSDSDGLIVTKMDTFPEGAYSLKVCTEDTLPKVSTAQMYTCCGKPVAGSVFNQVSSNCYTVDQIVFANAKYSLRVVFENGNRDETDTAIFNKFAP